MTLRRTAIIQTTPLITDDDLTQRYQTQNRKFYRIQWKWILLRSQRIKYYWNRPLFHCSLGIFINICLFLTLFGIIAFILFVYYGHHITCQYHLALCTPFFMYFQNHHNQELEVTLTDQYLEQQIICSKQSSLSKIYGNKMGFILSEQSQDIQQEWILKFDTYHDEIIIHENIINDDLKNCDEVLFDYKLEIGSIDNKNIVLVNSQLNSSKQDIMYNLFYHCMSEFAYCNDFGIIDLIQYDDKRIKQKYQYMLQFYHLGLKYIHIHVRHSNPSFDKAYFDMALQLI